MGRYRLHDIDHPYPALGGEPSDHDRLMVYDTTKQVCNPLSGHWQDRWVFTGPRPEVRAWLRDHPEN